MHEAGWRMLDRHEKTHYVSGWLKITTFRSTLQFTKHICIKGGNLALQIKASKTPLTSIIPASFPMVKSTGRKNHTNTSNQSINQCTPTPEFQIFSIWESFLSSSRLHRFTAREQLELRCCWDRSNSLICACVERESAQQRNRAQRFARSKTSEKDICQDEGRDAKKS